MFSSPHASRRWLLLALCCALPLFSAENAKRAFDLPAGTAEISLKKFSEQSGIEVLFATRLVGQVATNAVRGEFTDREALERLLAGTNLIAKRDARTGALTISIAPKTASLVSTRDSPRPPQDNRPAKPADEVPIELSPFVVQGEPGWQATETLAGTRLKTDLRDVPDQLEVFTKEFMENLAINTSDEATLYSMNADARADVLTDTDSPELAVANLSTTTSIRGMAQTQHSRRFFATPFPIDSYNTDSFTIASGANPVLVGAGLGAGFIDASASNATMRTQTMLKLQYSSDDSKRVQLNINRMLIPKKLALRVDGLWRDTHTFKKPNYDRNKRYTLSATFRPIDSTTIRASYENIDRVANLAPRNLPYDRVSLWHLADTIPGSPYTSPRPGYDNRGTVPAGASVATTTRIFEKNTAAAPVVIFGGAGTYVPPMNWGNSVVVRSPSADTAYRVPDPLLDGAAIAQRTFLDGTYFPTDVNVFGNSRKTTQFGDIKDLSIEQRVFRNLYLEVAFQERKYVSERYTPNQQTKVFVDANLYLPALYPGESTPRRNPNFGLPYIELNPEYRYEKWLGKNARASVAYELNAARDLKWGKWSRWLGRHRFNGTFEWLQEHETNVAGGIRATILDDPVVPGMTLASRTAANWANNATRRPLLRYYLTSPGGAAGPIEARDASWTYIDAAGNPARITTGIDSGFVSPITGKKLAPTAGTVAAPANSQNPGVFGWQGSLLPDREGNHRIVLTFGERHDRSRSAGATLPSITRDSGPGSGGTGLFPAADQVEWRPWGTSTNKRNRSKGVVVRPWQWIALSYHIATTYAVSTNSVDPYGSIYPGSGGETKGYGLQFEPWKRRFSLRLEKFETLVGPTEVSEGRMRAIVVNTRTIEQRVIELDPSLPRINVDAAGVGPGLTGAGAGIARVMNFRKAEGYEFSLNITPLPNWNIRINGSDSKTVNSDIGRPWLRFIAERAPVWQRVKGTENGEAVTWSTAHTNEDGSGQTLETYFNTTLANDIKYLQALDGRANPGNRGKRANFITSYRFGQGLLRGLSLTGAVRWRPPVIIGYPALALADGTTTYDISRPFRGKREVATDLGVAYRGRLKVFGGLRYTAQLNIRNVLDDGPLVPYRADTAGNIVSMATIDPRVFTFTWGLEF